MKDKNHRRRVAIYARTGSKGGDPSPAIVRQIERLQVYASAHRWEIQDEHVFMDDGYSGLKLDRPALNRLRSLVQDKQIDLILVTDTQRLTRSVYDTIALLTELKASHCKVKTLDIGTLSLSKLLTLGESRSASH